MISKYFLLIDGLNGGSTAAGHEGWFEISGFDFDIDTVLAAGTGSGAGTGKATFSPVTVQLSLSDGLAGVLKDAALGTHVQSVKIEGVTGGTNPAAVYDLSLGNVQITSAHDSSGPNDSLTFTYGQVALTTKVQNPDGSLAPGESFSYDVAAARLDADVPEPSVGASIGEVPTPAKYFLLIDGLNGGSTAAGHEGWFEISGFDFDIDTVLAAGTGSGAGTGKATFSPVTVQLSLSDGLAGVLKDSALGTHVQSVKIEGVTGGTNPAAVYDLSLGNVQITSAHDSSGPNDSLTFTYGQVALTTKNADGSPGESFSYDVAAARLDADVPEPSVGASIGEVPTPAKYFLLIDGLNGGSTAAGHEGWFEISGFDFDIDTVLAAGTGSGAGTGKATFSPVTVQLSLSDGLAGVLKDAALGTHVQSVKIEGVTGGANPAAVYDLSLGNVQITSAHDSSGPNDSLTFTYGQVALTTKVQNPDGSLAPGESFSYDVAAARLDADVPEPSVGASIGEVPTPAKYFLLIDGLNGGSTAAGHEGWFEISGFDFDIDTVLAAGTGSGAGTGKATFSPVTVQLSLSDGLAGVLKDAALGTHVQSVKIEGVTGGTNPAAVYDLSLGNVQITSAHDSSGPNDSLTFTYGQVALTTKVQNPDGSLAPGESFSYDVAAARLDADVPEPSVGASIGEVPTPAKYFLLIDGLNGGSTAAGHEGWFEISGFDFDIDTVLAAGTGSGAGTGKATFSPVTVQLSLSDGLAGVLKDAALGTHVQSVKIEGVTGGTNPAAVYDLSLGNVQITSAHDSSGPNDSLTFTYGQVALTTKNADGSPGESFSYDVAAARLDADVPEPSVGASIGEVPTPAKYFLLIDGLNGGSTAAGHEGWFEISGFDFDIDTVLAAGTGSGAGTGKATFSPVTVQLSLSDGLAGVLKDAALGTHVQSVKIEGVTGGANPAAVYDLSLGNVQITSAHDSSGPNDSLTFTYGQVALTTKNADGSPGESFGYDVARNQVIDPGTLSPPNPAGAAPVAAADGPYAAIEDTALIVNAAEGVLANDTSSAAGSTLPASAVASKYFLLIDGLNGGSTAAGHEGWFEISGFDFDIDTVLAAGTGSGAGTGKATFSPVTVQLSLSDGLAGVLKDAALGTHVQSVKIEGVTGGANPAAVYDLSLGNVQITSAHDSSGPNDSLTFTYGQVALTTKVQNPDGSLAPGESFSYDVAAARLDADVPEPSVGASIGEVPTPAKYFLLIDGLNGGSTAAGHEGWFEISGFDFDIDTVLAAGTGSGAGTGKATFSPVTVQLSLSDGLAGVLKDAALGTHVQSVKIEGVTGGTNPAAVYDLSLGNVQITSAHDSSGPNDSLTFTYGQVALTTKVQNPDGSLAPGESFSYDVAAARLDADVPEPSVGASIGEVPTPAKYFLLIDGLNGGSTAAGHEGWFEISGFDFDIDTVLAAGTGSGAGTGKATFSPVTVQLSLSDGLAGVLKDSALGTHVQSVKIEGVTGGTNPAAVYDLSLGNVQITSAHDSSGPNDSLTFTYGQVALTTKNADGSPGESFSYDVAAARLDADVPEPSVGASIGEVPTPAKYFLLIDGLNGGSTAAGHEGWFEISGFDFDIDTVLAAGTGSGAGTGKATFSPVTVQLSLSDGLAGVLKDAALGTHVQSVKIEGVTGGANPAAVYDLSLGNVQITSAHDSSGPNDSLTFTYGQVALTTKVQNPDGSLAPGESFSYDVAAARLDADVPEPSVGASIGEVPTPAKYFLLIDGLNGGSTAAGHEGWFEISGFDFDIDTVLAAGTGSGAGTGKATFSPVTVQLSLSDGLAGVLKDSALGTHVQSVKIEGVTGGTNPAAVYDLSLGNVQITSAHDSSGPNDSLTFTYGQVALTTKNADGSPGESFSYDVAAARLDADVPEPSVGASIGEVPTPAKYFLLIDGLNGGSTAAGHEGWFEISGFDFDIDTVLAAGTGSGAGTGKATFSPVTVQLSLDPGLAGALRDAATGHNIAAIKLEGVTGQGQAVYDLTLADVVLTQLHEANGGNDSLSFDYQKLGLITRVQHADGSTAPGGSFGYDVARNQIIDPPTLPTPSPNGVHGNVLTPELVSTTTHGALTLNPDGSFIYTPDANFNGTDSFVYHANDGSRDSNDVTVLINVAPVNDAPVITSAANIVVAENHMAVGTVTAVDPEQDAFLFAPGDGSDQIFFSIDPHTGALSFVNSPDFETPEDANHDNVYDLVVSATDVLGARSTQTIHVSVTDVVEVGQSIKGGSGNDTITGTTGNDTIDGGNGTDHINGGDGKDNLSGGNGDDTLIGGRGDDVLDGANGDDKLDGGVGNNQLSGGNGNDFLSVGDGNNVLDGGNGDDILTAGNGNNVFIGGNGNDNLTAGNGSNSFNGGNGDDTFHVGTGNNTLTGGNGNDRFVFGPIFGKDVVADFSRGDHIEFDGGVFANFQAVQAAMHQVGADTVISLGADHSITLQHVSAGSLHASDFLMV